VNEGENFTPRGQISPFGAKFTPRGEIHPWGSGVKLRMALWLLHQELIFSYTYFPRNFSSDFQRKLILSAENSHFQVDTFPRNFPWKTVQQKKCARKKIISSEAVTYFV
jgi:hypothetical protein